MSEVIAIGKLNKGYLIPDFQRNYVWGKKNIELLLDDIKDAFQNNKEKYLLGSIVVSSSNSENNSCLVIDGQQRLTTIKIICKVLGCSSQLCLNYENRKNVNYLFDHLDNENEQNEIFYIDDNECYKIYENYEFIDSYIQEHYCNVQNKFKQYFLENVCIIEKTLPTGIKLQHYFEVLNTAGEQLKKEDIAKAKLISYMISKNKKKESELFNYAWLLCCDNENDIPEEITNNIEQIYSSSSIEELYSLINIPRIGEGATVKLKDVVSKVIDKKRVFSRVSKWNITDYSKGKYTVCLTHIELLDVVLSDFLRKTISTIADNESTLEEFDVIKLIKSLLLYRVAFDKYIVRHEKGESKWKLPYSSDIKDRRLEMAEAMMAVSGVETSKFLVSTVAKEMSIALSEKRRIAPKIIIEELENKAKAKYIDISSQLDEGTRTNHFVFHWLDYLLFLNPTPEIKSKTDSFYFIDTSSVEHFQPQHPMKGELSESWNNLLNTFGNLALISPSFNSRQNNLDPKSKADMANGRDIESLKYEIMMTIARNKNGWTEIECSEHREQMKKILDDYQM